MSGERLQKILARAGVASRRASEELIREGRVTVNGRTVVVGDKADPEVDAIKVDGKRVRPDTTRRYLLLNKPRGYLTTRSDPAGRPTVYDLIPAGLHRTLFPVGRLDFDTEGLLLLTNDGDLAERIAHPRFGCSKIYAVKLRGVPDEASLKRLRAGIVLDGKMTRPARIESQPPPPGKRVARKNSWWRVEIREGRTRQIREMFFRIGHPVQRLCRIAIGSLSDPQLKPGEYRELQDLELTRLRRASEGRSGTSGGRPSRS
ncbi:MAG: rRNA pseudouridine synthase [Acidobacteriota bacterium]|nr:rRNA pseudouridine synthase [Acidobacteriota bacterium]